MNIVEYDLSFWIKQNADETNAQRVCDEIQKKLQDMGFNIISVSVPNLKTMGQVIGKEDRGYFVTITIGAGTGDLTTIKGIFSFNLDVLRFMLTRRNIRPEKPRNKRTRTGFKKSEPRSFVKENIEEVTEEVIKEDTKEAVTRPTTAEKEIDLNELDKKLDELLN